LIRLFNVYYPVRSLILLAGEALIVWTSFLLATVLQNREESYFVLVDQHGWYKIVGVTAFGFWYFNHEAPRIAERL